MEPYTETLALWCASACLFTLGISIITVALLRYGGTNRFKNKRIAELIWQGRNRNTDWWLDINRKEKDM